MEAFPPRISWAPDPSAILDATVCLQAFVLNVQGCIDNLASYLGPGEGTDGRRRRAA